MTRHIKPLIVELREDEASDRITIFEIHKGMPNRPKIYRRIGSNQRRVADDDPILPKLAIAVRQGVDMHKQAKEDAVRHAGRWYVRLLRFMGRGSRKALEVLFAASGPDQDDDRGACP